jgi:hypothetical protein
VLIKQQKAPLSDCHWRTHDGSHMFLDILLWAWVYRYVGAIQSLEASLYFSGITFTTVGYGDITLVKCWQLLSVGEAVNGVLMAGWSAAQLIFLVQRIVVGNSIEPEKNTTADAGEWLSPAPQAGRCRTNAPPAA